MANSTIFPSIQVSSSVSSAKHVATLVFSKGSLPAAVLKTIPNHLKDHPALQGERGAKLTIHGSSSQVIFGLGKIKDFNEQEAAEFGEQLGHVLNQERCAEVSIQLPDDFKSPSWNLNFAKGISLANYRFDELKSKAPHAPQALTHVTLCGKAAAKLGAAELKSVRVLAESIAFTRTLQELPVADADPNQVIARFQKEVKARGLDKVLEIEVWDEKRIQKEGMGLLWAVGKGSVIPPRFLIVRYGKDLPKSVKTLALVGKGVCFDTGGINLKTGPWRDLIEMKKDMSGAAGVLGAMLAIAALKPKTKVLGLTPLCINAIDAKSVTPGDVITSYAGKTVEIENTDAEGRLILADALHYAVLQKANHIVDVATLTGACVGALGHHHSGLFTNHDEFGDQVLEASIFSGEPAWKMPMSPRYGMELKSKIADMSNMGNSRNGGATIGGKFLEVFVDNTPWVHLDIAGTTDLGDGPRGSAQVTAAGRIVHTLTQLALTI